MSVRRGSQGGRAAGPIPGGAGPAARPGADRQPSARPGGGPGGRHRLFIPGEKPKDFKGTIKRLAAYLKPHALKLVIVLTIAILSNLFTILSPKVMGLAISRLFEDSMMIIRGVPGAQVDFSYLLRILAILGVLYAASAGFNYLQRYIMAGVSQQTVYALRRDVSEKLSRLPLKFFDSHSHGEVLSRVTNDVENISATLQQSITQIITAAVTLVGVVIMMLTISPVMTLIAMTTLPLYLLVTKPIIKRSQKYFMAQQRTLGELNGHVEEMYTGHTIVRAFGRENDSIKTFEKINERLYHAGSRAQFISGIIMPLTGFINNIGYVLVCVVGAIFVTRQRMRVGDVQAFIQYARQFTQPIVQTANISNILQSTVASAERVFEILDEEEEVPDPSAPKVLTQPRGDVVFRNVRFSYQPDVPLIENMNIDVKQGQTVAIVGPTGAGKTTLVNLLMRFYDVNGGSITIDGIDIREFRRGDLRSLFGMVLQDTWLFNGTIRDNIAYGKPGATEEEIVQAAKAAQAHYFIRTLPDGYDTVINEEASNLSQGQKQLLTIARTFLADPAILILDEATSSVDTRTEVLIQQAMAELMVGRTSFVIAHRLSTIYNADIILVMSKGRIIEMGTHHELLAQGGFYAELYNSQFASRSIDQAVRNLQPQLLSRQL